MEIYITKDGKESGPYTRDQVESLHHAGMIQLGDHVWHEGMLDWEPLHRFLGVRPPPPGVPIVASDATESKLAKGSRSGSGLRWLVALLLIALVGAAGWFGYDHWKSRGVLMVVNRVTWAVSDHKEAGTVAGLDSLLARQSAGTTTEREDVWLDRWYTNVLHMVSTGRAVNVSKGTKVRKLKEQELNSMIRLEDEKTIGTYWIRTEFLDQPK